MKNELIKCACGCGEKRWKYDKYGKRHKKDSKVKMKLSREKGLDSGKIKIWCKGLTKQIDKRLNYERPTSWKVGQTLKEKNYNWRGGKSFEPYGLDFNIKLKKSIRKRDNQVCMNCGIHREKLNSALSVHHINYDKSCNIPQNLISLCKKCHTTTNNNREQWTQFLQLILSSRYNYKYENKKIVLELKNEL